MSVWTVILIIAVIAAIILGVLYFVGRKMQAKQEDQRAQLDQMAQTVNMLVIDKKRMKIMEAGFPKMVTDNIPKRAKMSKVPVVKAKIGPKITPLLCDEAIFDDVPVKAEIKAFKALVVIFQKCAQLRGELPVILLRKAGAHRAADKARVLAFRTGIDILKIVRRVAALV